ncbi:hypothetical protein C0991_000480 [Blastosporella zonata]|nr:hypothetical protein C0991_000480 [Blastosporella zonata]
MTFTALLAHCQPQDARTSACKALETQLHLENTTILSAARVSAGTNVSARGSCEVYASVVSTPICRVEFVINTTSTSAVYAEAWLPDTWYGRVLSVGNGGLAGCVYYINLDYGASLHFATVSSNNGHDGTDGKPFFNNPEVINDFAFRAIHVQTVIGKQIAEAYYGQPHHRSYYLGCSTGGRQGTQAALKYPEDFDGIVAGAPATDWNHLLGWSAMLARYIGMPHASTSPSFISPALWNVIAAEILKQCDALDGVEDGIITEPDACEFRPEAILCAGGTTEGCLLVPNPGGISTFSGNLSKFRDRGGKFLTYHGRRDELIPSGNSKRMYNMISKTLGMPSLDTFYRLFLVPGMNHCITGPGAGNFGQRGVVSNVVNASTHNVLLAVVDWVETGVPPDTVVGTADDGTQREHCRYPQRSVWNGEAFVCQGNAAVLFLDTSGQSR